MKPTLRKKSKDSKLKL
jgi:hypothetical protein